MKNPSHKIVKGFIEGDKKAFADVYNMHYNRVYNFVKDLVKDREEAQDIVAETFIKLWKLHALFNTNENIRAFLYVTAKNASMDYFRYCQKQREKKQEASYILM